MSKQRFIYLAKILNSVYAFWRLFNAIEIAAEEHGSFTAE